jgi:hypothetical protein
LVEQSIDFRITQKLELFGWKYFLEKGPVALEHGLPEKLQISNHQAHDESGEGRLELKKETVVRTETVVTESDKERRPH